MKRRRFEIIRRADMPASFDYNNVLVHYVGTCPQTGISFFCSLRTNYGVRVYPDGHKVLTNATTTSTKNSKVGYNAKRKERYLRFADAFGHHQNILVSHAVYMAAGRTIPEGMTLDHINGCTTDNRIENLRCVTPAINARDGGFLRKIRNKDFNPARIERAHLLRYYTRMALIKQTASRHKYNRLTRRDLTAVLTMGNLSLSDYLYSLYGLQLKF